MCGISASVGNIDSAKIAITILSNQLGRGIDATGMSWVNNGKVELLKEAKSPLIIMEKWAGILKNIDSYMVIAHNRSASCNLEQKNLDSEAHPFMSEDGTFTLLHNGVVPGFTIFTPYMKTIGHKFTTGIDSELYLHMLEDILARVPNRVKAMEEFYKVYSGNILILFNDGDLWGFSGNSSFVLVNSNKGSFIASDIYALNKSIADLNIGNKAEIFYPDSPAYINIKLTKNGHHLIKFYQKWTKYFYKTDDWIFCKVTYCDFCHTSNIPTEKYNNMDRCFKCYTKKIVTPIPYSNCRNLMGYNVGYESETEFSYQEELISSLNRNTQQVINKEIAEKETVVKEEDKAKIKTVGICSHCHMPHADKEIIVCASCHKFLCKTCFGNHICKVKQPKIDDYIAWLRIILSRKYTGDI